QWTKLVGCLRGLLQVSPVPELPARALYEHMLKLVITGHKSNISHWLLPDDLAAEKDVHAAISMIESDPIRWKTLSSVAYALGCATGPLENAILRHTRRTPQALLLESRLHGLHMTLSKASDHTFSEAFRKYGFRLSSQFLVAYRQRFGEPPSATYRKNANAVEIGTNSHDPLSPASIDSFIDCHLIEGPSLADLARHFGLSESSTIAFFKAHFSRTPIQYVIERRLERAKWMLCNTTESILSIALECGFGGQSYLATQIKRCYGVTPRQLRASHGLAQV
ncbi:MAG: helix-turn-helix domain-containing protein, partial [Pandoraea sp.]